jgi:hypothetical protein
MLVMMNLQFMIILLNHLKDCNYKADFILASSQEGALYIVK